VTLAATTFMPSARSSRMMTRPLEVLPADMDVPMTRMSGTAGPASGTGATKSAMFSATPSRTACPR
jgi:hypothetical protein